MRLEHYLDSPRIHKRLIDRLAYARDASLYRLVPEAVVRPVNEAEVQALLAYARETQTPLTFRTGGTSLSGQSVTRGIIAEVVHDWQKATVHPQGRWIRMQPGVVGARANQYLQPFQRRIGPDPASLQAAMIGGIVANNASGMACGVANNSYHTLRSIRFILPNGHCYDSGEERDYPRFLDTEPTIFRGLTRLREGLLDKPELVKKVRRKYGIKNTLGYSLNAILDYEHPLDILAHLLVGSEGTLAFIASVTLNTIPDPAHKSTGLVLFNSLEQACETIPYLTSKEADAVELMDYASLTTARYLADPPYDPARLVRASAALLCEFQDPSGRQLTDTVREVEEALQARQGTVLNGFHTNADQRDKLWKLRKGLYPTVGALRRTGTSLITEDVCYQVPDLPRVVAELRSIFIRCGYGDAVIFGHAKHGNLHIVASIDLESQAGVRRYERMIDALVDLTVGKLDGSLKAEHGTGRNMAPFVEQEWGPELYTLMGEVKLLVDPHGILNPGVLLNSDPKVHLRDLKPLPRLEESIDLCVECGFCEPVCPSRALTLSPRQRIAVVREMNSLPGERRAEVARDYRYAGEATCAVDGLCEVACPVNIDTGEYIEDLRFSSHSRSARRIAAWTVDHFTLVQTAVRSGLSLAHLLTRLGGSGLLHRITTTLNRLSDGNTPLWNPDLPKKAPRCRSLEAGSGETLIYYTTCINRLFSAGPGGESLASVMQTIAEHTGVRLVIPGTIYPTCCGMPFASKGYRHAHQRMLAMTILELQRVYNGGTRPILVDTSPCSYQFQSAGSILKGQALQAWRQLTFIDLIPFLWERIKAFKPLPPLEREIILHPTCSTRKMDQTGTLQALAARCATTVVLPPEAGCCGFAGDRGLLYPELTASATRQETAVLKNLDQRIQGRLQGRLTGYSSSRTCEVGLTTATGRSYESIALLVRDYLEQGHLV